MRSVQRRPELEAFSRVFLKGHSHSLTFPLTILAEKEDCVDKNVLIPQTQGMPSVQRRIGI